MLLIPLCHFSRFRPDIDVLRDPNLGGRAKDIRQPEGKPEYSQPEVSQFGDTQSFSAERPGDMLPRPSYHSARRGDAIGNLRSAKGSQVDSECNVTSGLTWTSELN